jgi:Thioredoxin-like
LFAPKRQANVGHAVVKTSPSRDRQKSFEEIVRGNIFVWFAGLLVTGFGAGISSYEFYVRTSGQMRIAIAQFEQMQEDQKAKGSKIDVLNAEIRSEKLKTEHIEQQLHSLHENELILRLFLDNYLAYRRFDLKKEVGADLSFGQCGSAHCFKLRYLGTKHVDDQDWVEIGIIGPGLGESEAKVSIPTNKGTQFGVQTAILDYLLVIEDDRIQSFRLGVGLREGTGDPEGYPRLSFGGLTDDAIPTRKQLGKFYAKWGVSGMVLPFNESADALKDSKSATDRARAENKLLLVQFGANWSPDCLVMHKILNSDDVKSALIKSFELLSIDVGRFDKNRDRWPILAEKANGASFPIPYFLAVDPKKDMKVVDSAGWPGGSNAKPERVKEEVKKWLSSVAKNIQQ